MELARPEFAVVGHIWAVFGVLFGVFRQRYERGSTLVTSNLPFEEWTSVFGSERPGPE